MAVGGNEQVEAIRTRGPHRIGGQRASRDHWQAPRLGEFVQRVGPAEDGAANGRDAVSAEGLHQVCNGHAEVFLAGDQNGFQRPSFPMNLNP